METKEKTDVMKDNHTAIDEVDMINNNRTMDMEGHHNKEIMVIMVTMVTIMVIMEVIKITTRVMIILHKNPNQLK